MKAVFLHVIWRLRHRRLRTDQAFSSEAIISTFAHTLEGMISRSFFIAEEDIVSLAGVSREWFRGRRAEQDLDFWYLQGVLAEKVPNADGTHSLRVHVPRAFAPPSPS